MCTQMKDFLNYITSQMCGLRHSFSKPFSSCQQRVWEMISCLSERACLQLLEFQRLNVLPPSPSSWCFLERWLRSSMVDLLTEYYQWSLWDENSLCVRNKQWINWYWVIRKRNNEKVLDALSLAILNVFFKQQTCGVWAGLCLWLTLLAAD